MVLEMIWKLILFLFDVVVFMLWFVIVCIVVGMMLFGGCLNSREYSGVGSLNVAATAICSIFVVDYLMLVVVSVESLNYFLDELLCLNCRKNMFVLNDTYCCDFGVLFVDGFVNFDDFVKGVFVVL